jgi:DNA mismatch endonuclease (patch repair protein)
MRDRLSRERRSWNMSRVRSKDTKPEKAVRSLLHSMGYRFRLHDRRLPGSPDIVLRRYSTVVFVHGCFWHRHHGCPKCTTPTHNRAFWVEKLDGNAARDRRHRKRLRDLGWHVVTVWECFTERPRQLARQLARKLEREIQAGSSRTRSKTHKAR